MLAALWTLAVLATPTPMAIPARPPAAIPRTAPQAPPRLKAPRLQATPRPAVRRPAPRPRPTPRPKPAAARKPAWRPPAGTVYVDGSGLYPNAVRMRYGRPLRFIEAKGRAAPLSLVAVDPNRIATGQPRALSAFPDTLTTATRWAWLGDADGLKHRHWTLATGPSLTVMPETFLALHDEIWGAGVGYLWPARFLLYVVVDDRWRKLVVTLDR